MCRENLYNKNTRDPQIYNLRKEGLTLLEIGKEFNLSKERVRQIVVRQSRRERWLEKKKSKHICKSWDSNGVCTDPDCKETKPKEELCWKCNSIATHKDWKDNPICESCVLEE